MSRAIGLDALIKRHREQAAEKNWQQIGAYDAQGQSRRRREQVERFHRVASSLLPEILAEFNGRLTGVGTVAWGFLSEDVDISFSHPIDDGQRYFHLRLAIGSGDGVWLDTFGIQDGRSLGFDRLPLEEIDNKRLRGIVEDFLTAALNI
jgi:hypothetical protein